MYELGSMQSFIESMNFREIVEAVEASIFEKLGDMSSRDGVYRQF